ncbi:MAG: hypothetical protein V3T41_00010 [bacterium]
MLNFKRCAPQIPVVLAFLVLWVSFAWGLPADAPASEGEAEVTPEYTPATPAEVAETPVGAEPPAAPDKVTGWFYLGLGLGSNAVGANAAINMRYKKYVATLAATLDSPPPVVIWGNFSESYDIGLLFGYYPVRVLRIAGGVAWVVALDSYNYDFFHGYCVRSRTIGVPIEFEFSPFVGRFVGLGIVGHLNVNNKATFATVTVGIQLGKLK